MASSENDKDVQELLYLGMAVVGVIALKQLWTVKIRPLIENTWGDLRVVGHAADIPLIGPIDQADLIGIAALAVPFLIVLAVVASKIKSRRRAARKTAQYPAD